MSPFRSISLHPSNPEGLPAILLQVVGTLWVIQGTIMEDTKVDPAFLFSIPKPVHSNTTVEEGSLIHAWWRRI